MSQKIVDFLVKYRSVLEDIKITVFNDLNEEILFDELNKELDEKNITLSPLARLTIIGVMKGTEVFDANLNLYHILNIVLESYQQINIKLSEFELIIKFFNTLNIDNSINITYACFSALLVLATENKELAAFISVNFTSNSTVTELLNQLIKLQYLIFINKIHKITPAIGDDSASLELKNEELLKLVTSQIKSVNQIIESDLIIKSEPPLPAPSSTIISDYEGSTWGIPALTELAGTVQSALGLAPAAKSAPRPGAFSTRLASSSSARPLAGSPGVQTLSGSTTTAPAGLATSISGAPAASSSSALPGTPAGSTIVGPPVLPVFPPAATFGQKYLKYKTKYLNLSKNKH